MISPQSHIHNITHRMYIRCVVELTLAAWLRTRIIHEVVCACDHNTSNVVLANILGCEFCMRTCMPAYTGVHECACASTGISLTK